LRPALYGSYHEVVNASAANGPEQPVVVAGNLCESGDVFTQTRDGLEDRPLAAPEVGHLLAFKDTGAYGMSQSSQYNMRPRPAEVVVNKGEPRLTRRRETYKDLVGVYIGKGGPANRN
ncbi:MAG: diaminopimelate decarboxylase, partial [SAR324 cluster bacterium]|nr:diaminopimelate decarboxylase [SAR324 cluster bacterium]